ncbi:Aldehyde/histidinol dehydrogenase [Microdochium bolleyi]|uniref:Aldehyde/histidinol dehydrogenase n=1 Tax=Microdochium bolleyi TaxID=196109 RepID=A0A136J956_9PEZI|nr:Aldehyde/histidinol dehydrogenase [Microdochium bolleyi]
MGDTTATNNDATKAKRHNGEVVPLIINGIEKASSDTFPIISPATGEAVSECSNASVEDALSAVQAAEQVLESWSSTTIAHRRDVLLRATVVLERRADELQGFMQSECGAAEAWSKINIGLAKDCLLGTASRIGTLEGKIPGLNDPDIGALVLREPYGVIFAMAPWNAPYALGFRAVVGPLAAGNTVVFKGSELSPRCLWAVCSVLLEAGVPAGALNYITCTSSQAPAVTEAVISAQAVKKINFTGSTSVGRIIGRLAGQHLKPVLLELGGKAPAIICDDADLEHAARQCVLGAFLNAGQICMSTERILVQHSIQDAFEAKLAAAAAQLFPAASGPLVLIDRRSASKNEALVQDSVTKGARLVYGDVTDASRTKEMKGAEMRPVILSGIQPNMDLYLAESFGPSVSVIPFNTDTDALHLANEGDYGLSAAVFSTDLRRALRLARRIESGAVHINRMTVQDEAGLPHGGAKASGYGRFNGGFEEWTRVKNITYDL